MMVWEPAPILDVWRKPSPPSFFFCAQYCANLRTGLACLAQHELSRHDVQAVLARRLACRAGQVHGKRGLNAVHLQAHLLHFWILLERRRKGVEIFPEPRDHIVQLFFVEILVGMGMRRFEVLKIILDFLDMTLKVHALKFCDVHHLCFSFRHHCGGTYIDQRALGNSRWQRRAGRVGKAGSHFFLSVLLAVL